MPLADLWASFFGPSSPSSSILPFVNDYDWTIWTDWGYSCSLLDEEGQMLHQNVQEHWRDLYILDGEGKVSSIFNLTSNNLSDPEKYDIVKQAFLDAYIP